MRVARPGFLLLGLALAGLVVLIDQSTKHWIFQLVLADNDEIRIAPFFSLVKRYNLGVSFSLFSSDHPIGPWVLSGLALAILVALMLWLARATEPMGALALGLVIGGALGNVIDRLRIGAVQDFLLFHWRDWAWPAFNAADSAITLGVGLLLLEGALGSRRRRGPAQPR
jgi:signal peptidase II